MKRRMMKRRVASNATDGNRVGDEVTEKKIGKEEDKKEVKRKRIDSQGRRKKIQRSLNPGSQSSQPNYNGQSHIPSESKEEDDFINELNGIMQGRSVRVDPLEPEIVFVDPRKLKPWSVEQQEKLDRDRELHKEILEGVGLDTGSVQECEGDSCVSIEGEKQSDLESGQLSILSDPGEEEQSSLEKLEESFGPWMDGDLFQPALDFDSVLSWEEKERLKQLVSMVGVRPPIIRGYNVLSGWPEVLASIELGVKEIPTFTRNDLTEWEAELIYSSDFMMLVERMESGSGALTANQSKAYRTAIMRRNIALETIRQTTSHTKPVGTDRGSILLSANNASHHRVERQLSPGTQQAPSNQDKLSLFREDNKKP